MNPAKETKARKERRERGPQVSERRRAQLARLRAEPPALTTKPTKAKPDQPSGKSRHLRIWRGER